MRWLILFLLTACAHPATDIKYDDQGRISRIEQPKGSYVQTPTVTVDLRGNPKKPGFFDQLLGVMVLRETN